MQGKCVKTRYGGLTELKPADAEIQAITIEVIALNYASINLCFILFIFFL